MYPRNAATPPTIAVGSIYLIADGTLQTSGASVRVITAGGAWGAGGGTLGYDTTSGAITYVPTQAETNGEWFIVSVYKASCTSASVTVVTTASATAGRTILANEAHGGAAATLTTASASLGAVSATTVTASGAVALQSTLAVTGTTTLTGAVSLGSTLAIVGAVTAPSLTLSGAFQATTIVSTGTTTLNALTVTGALTAATVAVTTTGLGALTLGATVIGTITQTGATSWGAATVASYTCTGAETWGSWVVTAANAYPLAAADNGATYVARAPSGTETLDTLATDIASVQTTVNNIANVSAPAYEAPSSYTLTTGNQTSGTYASVDSLNQVYHVHTDAAGTLSLTYHFTMDPDELANEVFWSGRWNGVNDTLLFEVYDWTAPGWVTWFTQIGVAGTTSASDFAKSVKLVAKYTGTGADAGKVNVRITGSGLTSCTLSTDQLIVGKTTRAGGIANGSTVTLAATAANLNYEGYNWTLALGGQAIDGAHFSGCEVSGTGTCAVSQAEFFDAHINAGTTIGPTKFYRTGFATTVGSKFTAGSAGEFVFVQCFSEVAGSGTPYYTFAVGSGSTSVSFRGYYGGAHVTLDSYVSGYSMECVGGGGHTVVAGGCASIEIRGTCRTITLTLSGTEVCQCVGVFGPIAIDGTAPGATVRLYGVHGVVTNTSGCTVQDFGVSLVNINTEADTALSDIKLDHLAAVADSDDVVDNSIIAKLASKSATADWSSYVNTTDSLEANRDNIGTAGAGLTEAGGTGDQLTAVIPADIYSYEVQVIESRSLATPSDTYVVVPYENLVEVPHGDATLPTITVKDHLGNTLINAAVLVEIGTTGRYQYVSTALQIPGRVYTIDVSMTIGGSARTGQVRVAGRNY